MYLSLSYIRPELEEVFMTYAVCPIDSTISSDAPRPKMTPEAISQFLMTDQRIKASPSECLELVKTVQVGGSTIRERSNLFVTIFLKFIIFSVPHDTFGLLQFQPIKADFSFSLSSPLLSEEAFTQLLMHSEHFKLVNVSHTRKVYQANLFFIMFLYLKVLLLLSNPRADEL